MTEWNASGYQAISSLQETIATEQLSRLTLQGNEHILDIGCGNGKITAAIAERVPQGSALGVDVSHNMITFAQQQYAPSHPNLRFAVADARNLPYSHEFDQIVSFNALHWVPELSTAIQSIHTALKPTGKVMLRFVPEGDRQSIEDVIEEVCHLPSWLPYFQNHSKPYIHPTPEAFCLLVEQQELKVLQLHVEDRSWNFQTRQAFFDYCKVTLAEWTRFLPETEWTAFITEVLDRYQEVAAITSAENNTFKFYQMEAVLTSSVTAMATGR